MTRQDYRPERRSNAERRRAAGKKGGILTGLTIGLILGLAVAAGLLWLLFPRAGDFRSIESAPEVRIPPTSLASPAEPSATPGAPAASPADARPQATERPDYTFYDILSGTRAAKPQTPVPPRKVYWLQVAALQYEADAEELRAKISLLGLDAVVRKAGEAEHALYRVRVGPFDGEAEAKPAQDTLTENNFEARLLKETVTP